MADTQTTIAEKIADIKTDRAKIRNHMKDNWGVATDTDKLKELATKITAIEKKTVAKELPEGTGKYYIPKGYHDGTGWVEAVNNEDLDAQEYKLEEGRSVTPTTDEQEIIKSEGFYGLGAVKVLAIPSQYKDTTDVTATQEDVLATKLFVDKQGLKPGTMTNNGKVTKTLDTETTSYPIAKGYHDGTGSVSITTEEKTAIPTKAIQTVTPTSGKVLSKVTVRPIPVNYADTTDSTAKAENILAGETAYTYGTLEDGTRVAEKTTGTMPNNESEDVVLDTNTTSYKIPKGYHTGGGTVSVETEEKSVTPTKGQQTIFPTSGKVLERVTVQPIPGAYIATSDATATASCILYGETAYVKGSKVVGTMPNIGTRSAQLDVNKKEYTIPRGYHSGNGVVFISTHDKTVTPTKETQTITPVVDYLLEEVTVNPIPDEYQDVSNVDVAAGEVLADKIFVTADGTETTGTMPNNGAVTASINGLTTTSYTIPAGYHDGSGTVSLTSDIEAALAEI